MRSLIIGDVHGCLRELDELLKLLNPQAEDEIIFVGDLIHKGPDSAGVIQRVRQLKAHSILGNHELRFLKSIRDPSFDNKETLRLKTALGPKLGDVVTWMQSLPSFIERPNFIVVHAGIIPNRDLSESSIQDLATIRTWDGVGINLQNPVNPPWHNFYKGSKLVIYGHWAQQGLCVRENSIGLDSGCVYGKQLSALILPERKIVQVPSHTPYQVT